MRSRGSITKKQHLSKNQIFHKHILCTKIYIQYGYLTQEFKYSGLRKDDKIITAEGRKKRIDFPQKWLETKWHFSDAWGKNDKTQKWLISGRKQFKVLKMLSNRVYNYELLDVVKYDIYGTNYVFIKCTLTYILRLVWQ